MSKAGIESTYADVERLIWKLVHKFYRSHGAQYGTLEELYSVAGEGFCVAVNRYDRQKAKCFTTYVYMVVQHSLLQHVRTCCKRRKTEVLLDAPQKTTGFNLTEFLEELSDEGKFVVQLILDSPKELLQVLFSHDDRSSARSYKAGLRKYLKEVGWLNEQISAAFAEIQEALQ